MPEIDPKRVKLMFYTVCHKCNREDHGRPEGEWAWYDTVCVTCDLPMTPEVRIFDKKVGPEGIKDNG